MGSTRRIRPDPWGSFRISWSITITGLRPYRSGVGTVGRSSDAPTPMSCEFRRGFLDVVRRRTKTDGLTRVEADPRPRGSARDRRTELPLSWSASRVSSRRNSTRPGPWRFSRTSTASAPSRPSSPVTTTVCADTRRRGKNATGK